MIALINPSAERPSPRIRKALVRDIVARRLIINVPSSVQAYCKLRFRTKIGLIGRRNRGNSTGGPAMDLEANIAA